MILYGVSASPGAIVVLICSIPSKKVVICKSGIRKTPKDPAFSYSSYRNRERVVRESQEALVGKAERLRGRRAITQTITRRFFTRACAQASGISCANKKLHEAGIWSNGANQLARPPPMMRSFLLFCGTAGVTCSLVFSDASVDWEEAWT
jgi:hypothetical protein